MPGLVIHDLSPEEWEGIKKDYDGWETVSDNGTIKPCIGCFGCWKKTPGCCVVKDGYENMGALIHHADEVTVISRYTFGGFSGFVKNVFDRCLAYVLPQFEISGGESHHQKRYAEDKPFTFIIYGKDLSEYEKNCARRYVAAVCANIRGHVKDVAFREGEALPAREAPVPAETSAQEDPGKALLLNCSMRSEKGNSAKLSKQLAERLKTGSETVALKKYSGDVPGLLERIEQAPSLVLCMPLYVDGLPSQAVRFMETALREYRGGAKKVYVLLNMGLYESGQLVNLFEAVRQWCGAMDFEYCGGLGVSSGEVVGVLLNSLPLKAGFTSRMSKGMDRLAAAIDGGDSCGDIYADLAGFPRPLFVAIANNSWKSGAKANGLKPSDLYRQF